MSLKKHNFWIIFLLLLGGSIQSQELNHPVPVLDFDGFREYINKEDDTIRVINFWATWCIPCVKELPEFQKALEASSGQKIKFIFVSLDMSEHLDSRVIPFLRKQELKGKHLLLDDPDANSWIPEISETWTGAIPATLIYHKEKKSFHEGSLSYGELMEKIASINPSR